MPSKARAKTATPNRAVGQRGVVPLSAQERLERDADLGWMAELAASDYRRLRGHSLGSSPSKSNGVADAAHDSSMSPGQAKWFATKLGRSGGGLGTGGIGQVEAPSPPMMGRVGSLRTQPHLLLNGPYDYRGTSLKRNRVPKDPTVGLCLGPYGGPRGVGCSL